MFNAANNAFTGTEYAAAHTGLLSHIFNSLMSLRAELTAKAARYRALAENSFDAQIAAVAHACAQELEAEALHIQKGSSSWLAPGSHMHA
jgi:hypothetical protein